MLKIRRNILKLRNPETSEFESINGLFDGGNEDSPSKYDADNNGIVDDSDRLGGKLPSEYAPSSHTHTEYAPADHSHEETDPTIEGWAKKDSEYEVTGNPITLENFEHMPMNVVTTFEPKQEGSGDPYPAGGGRNKSIPFSSATHNGVTFVVNGDGSVNVSGTATVETALINDFYIPAGSYVISGAPSGSSFANYDIYIAQMHGDTGDDGTVVARSFDGTTETNFSFDTRSRIRFIIRIPAGEVDSTKVFYPMIRLASDTDTSYAPPSNIRPITGWDALNLNHARKNLLTLPYVHGGVGDVRTHNGITFTVNGDGSITANGTVEGDRAVYLVNYIDLGVQSIAPGGTNGTYALSEKLRYNSGVKNCSIELLIGTTWDNVTFYPQVELGTVATEFEPPQVELHTVQFSQTVYSGSYAWNTGALASNMLCVNAADLTVSVVGTTNAGVSYARLNLDIKPISEIGASSHYKIVPAGTAYVSGMARFFSGYIFVYDARFTDTDTVLGILAAENPQFVYEIEPTEIQLDPTQIKTLQGTNTFYGDGTITVSGDKNLHTLVSTVCKSVPTPTSEDSSKFLRGDGTWATVDIPQSVITDTDPGAGVEVDYPDGTVIDVYE